MKKYLLLGSRVALGVYVPAVILLRRLVKEGNIAEFIYLEELYVGKEEALEKNKRQFHKNFKLAKAGHVLPNRNVSSVDTEKKLAFFEKCTNEKYDRIIIFSGFWLSIMEELINYCPDYVDRVMAIHMDTTYSNSWKLYDRSFVKEEWLFNKERNEIKNIIDATDYIRPKDKNGRIVVHGGGWGMGDYSSKIKALNDLGYKLDIILYYKDELDESNVLNKYYLLDPDWRPSDKKNDFPHLLVYENGDWREYEPEDEALGSPMISLIRHASAVLSKPGGGTLLDSMITGTPIIFSEELAVYEKTNKDLWEEKMFGIDYYEWINDADRELKLEKITENIQKSLNNTVFSEV